ncbi:MAG: flagellar biosynthesis protein FlhB [Deltaproteobacteria bacterium]|nr:flagellar biosynthesis protein FlhB [Deltaproteobacteria bacterium]
MAEKGDQERTEKPTGKKLSKAREEGQVAKSQEISTTFILFGALGVFLFAGPWMFWALSDFMHGIFQNLGTLHLEGISARAFLFEVLQQVGLIIMPLLLVLLILGIAANLLQVGFLFTLKPFKPKLSKFNPITGMKKFVSLKSLVELLKSLFKILFIGGISWLVLRGELDAIPSLMEMSVGQILTYLGTVSLKLIFYVGLGMLVLAAIDFTYQRWQHTKDLMMSKQEVKDEAKQAEGDPQIKGKIRQAQREMAMRRMMESVPDADVVITNPTTLAVAVKYDAEQMFAPQVVAKGAKLMAERIKDIAGENHVPIVENKPLAQVLFKSMEIGDLVPPDLYKAVAEVLAYVYKLKGKGNST